MVQMSKGCSLPRWSRQCDDTTPPIPLPQGTPPTLKHVSWQKPGCAAADAARAAAFCSAATCAAAARAAAAAVSGVIGCGVSSDALLAPREQPTTPPVATAVYTAVQGCAEGIQACQCACDQDAELRLFLLTGTACGTQRFQGPSVTRPSQGARAPNPGAAADDSNPRALSSTSPSKPPRTMKNDADATGFRTRRTTASRLKRPAPPLPLVLPPVLERPPSASARTSGSGAPRRL
jgi:hypothetical protein